MTHDSQTLPDQYDEEQIIERMGGEEAILKAMSDYQQVRERMDHEQDALVPEVSSQVGRNGTGWFSGRHQYAYRGSGIR